jgi:hypothetical protein
MRHFIPFIAVIFMTLGANTYAQSIDRMVISSTGFALMEDGYYLNQTVGEAFSGTFFANFNFLTQGFQQPTLINEGPSGQPQSFDAIDVYPNPVSEHVGNLLTVSFRVKELTHYYIEIFNVHGARLFHQSYENMTSQDIKVDFSRFGQGIFFVRVYSANLKMDRHFKIEKF